MIDNVRLTAGDLAKAIGELPRNQVYGYVDKSTTGRIQIVSVEHETLRIKRYNPVKGKTLAEAREESISSQML